MKVLLLLVLIVGTLAQIPTDSCSLCTALVNGLEDYVSLNNPRTKESLMTGLQKIQDDVCPHIWGNSYLTAQQCSDYISLYGPYVVDMFLSQAQPALICKMLGLCQTTTCDGDYKLVFPTITNQSIDYQTPFTKVVSAPSQYSFKLFLGSPKFEEEFLYVELLRGDKAACTFSLEVTNKTDFTQTMNCNEKTCKCAEVVNHPGRGVWYYVNVNVTQILNPTSVCSFALRASVRPPVPPPRFMFRQLSILFIVLPILICLFCCCCCCVCLKRKCRASGGVCSFSRRCGKQQQQVETGAIAMQPINAAATPVPETAVPMGYYYVPTFAGSYVPLSQDAQPVVYPQFVPVQQE